MTTNQAGTQQAKADENKTENNDKSHDKTNDVKDNASESLSKKTDTTEESIFTEHSFLSDKVEQIGTFAQQTFDKASNLGTRATQAISNSAEYVKNIDVGKARDTVKNTVAEKPELSIAIAGITGLIIGLLIGRTRK